MGVAIIGDAGCDGLEAGICSNGTERGGSTTGGAGGVGGEGAGGGVGGGVTNAGPERVGTGGAGGAGGRGGAGGEGGTGGTIAIGGSKARSSAGARGGEGLAVVGSEASTMGWSASPSATGTCGHVEDRAGGISAGEDAAEVITDTGSSGAGGGVAAIGEAVIGVTRAVDEARASGKAWVSRPRRAW